MPLLTAEFIIEIKSPCLLSWPEDEIPNFEFDYEDSHIIIKLIPHSGWKSKNKDEVNWTTGLERIQMTISRTENNNPPVVEITPEGTKDYTALGGFLNNKLPDYRRVAFEISNRILQYFKYSLFTPLVIQIPTWEHSLHNPRWFDEEGQELIHGGIFVAPPIPGIHGNLGARKLTPKELPELQKYIIEPVDVKIDLTLLSDAQSAWYEKNLRRSILELAICTELMVKRRFFAQESPAGAAFDYLEDKAKVSVSVPDLMDAVANEAFERSYKKEQPDNFTKINYLLRCRNKTAHRGELTYRDDKGKIINVDASIVESWWYSVVDLKKWLESL